MKQYQPRTALTRIRALLVTMGLVLVGIVGVAGPASANVGTNDYPWTDATAVPGGTYEWGYTTCPSNDTGCKVVTDSGYGMIDPWGYYLRNCTSFVAWRLSQQQFDPSGMGMAANWGNSAKATNLVNSTPAPGAVAWWAANKLDNGYSVGSSGHVAYVTSVNTNGSANIEEYNYGGTGTYHTRTITPGTSTQQVRFIHLADLSTTAPPTSVSEPLVQAYQSPTTGAASVYARGASGDLLTWWTGTNGLWNGPASLGGVQTDSPALTVDSAGNTSVYMRGAGGNLGTTWTGANGQWNGPVSLGGNFTGTPAANRTNGNTAVFARGVNGDLLTWWTGTNGLWNGPASLGGNFTGTPAITVTSASTSIYARGVNGDLLTWWTGTNGLWNGPASLGGNFVGSPAVTLGPTGGTAVYVRGVNNDLQTYWTSSSGTWNGPASLGGSISASPAAYQSPSGDASIYARGANGDLVTYWTGTNGLWNGPASLGGSLTGIPAITVTSGNTAIYGRSSSGALYTWWTGANGQWNGPASLGGSIGQ